jgi:hypothetical protein
VLGKLRTIRSKLLSRASGIKMQPRQPVRLGVARSIGSSFSVQQRPPRRGTCGRNEPGRIAQKASGWAAGRHPIWRVRSSRQPRKAAVTSGSNPANPVLICAGDYSRFPGSIRATLKGNKAAGMTWAPAGALLYHGDVKLLLRIVSFPRKRESRTVPESFTAQPDRRPGSGRD